MNSWDSLADDKTIKQTVQSLRENGIESIVLNSKAEAKKKVIELTPQGAEVFTMTSETLNAIGIPGDINDSGRYNSVRQKLSSMNRETQSLEMQKLGSSPEYAIGSVHAVTADGKVLIASNTGSQLPAYAYGSAHVIWIVGTQKIVKDLDAGMKRIYEYVLPLESKRVQKAYGMPHSNVNKLLIINKENVPNRIIILFIKEKLGF
jgi:hypothetical protein